LLGAQGALLEPNVGERGSTAGGSVLREWADPNIVAISKILSENAEMKRKRARERHTK
jgi:hypothetical protein